MVGQLALQRRAELHKVGAMPAARTAARRLGYFAFRAACEIQGRRVKTGQGRAHGHDHPAPVLELTTEMPWNTACIDKEQLDQLTEEPTEKA